MYRRRSEEGSVTPTQEHRDVFDDEFAVDDFDLVADGFRPESAREGDERHSQDPPIHTTSAHYATDPDLITPTAPAPNRSSISKTRSDENPFASPEDGPRMDFERSPSIHSQSTASFAPGIARRSTSSASSNLFANTSSPRFGADGPSHPYAMYPQGTIPRSPSIATTSTVQPNRNSSVRHAPQHPYAMYPQGVTEDDHLEDEDDAQAAAPAVGFPGLGQPYQRVRGPDGEEQDIIGMDGHAEQLPPYTRYPEEGPKMPILAVPGELHSRGPVAGTDPGMPLMHQHIPPPAPTPQQQRPQSMTDQSQLERHSIQDRGIDSHASLPLMERVASESTGYTEKSWKEKTWKEKRRTRFCGVQFLWLVMGICALGFIGAIVGGIMGGYATGTESGRKYVAPPPFHSLFTPTDHFIDKLKVAAAVAAVFPRLKLAGLQHPPFRHPLVHSNSALPHRRTSDLVVWQILLESPHGIATSLAHRLSPLVLASLPPLGLRMEHSSFSRRVMRLTSTELNTGT